MSAALFVLVLLGSGCGGSDDLTHGDSRLVGIWELELQSELSLDELRAMEEATFAQMIFLSDGRMVHGGLMLGHRWVEVSRWEAAEEVEDRVTVRVTRADGRVDEMDVAFEGDDSLVLEGPKAMKLPMRRVSEVAPMPWLREAVER